MLVAQSRQAERAVLFCILLVTNAYSGRVEQPDNGSKNFYTREAMQLQVMVDTSTNGGKSFTKGDHMVIFCLVAYFAPARMVTILFAPFGIASSGLDMSIGFWADPYIGPRRRDAQRANTLQDFLVMNRLSIEANVAKVFPCALAFDTWGRIADVAEASGSGNFSRVDYFFPT